MDDPAGQQQMQAQNQKDMKFGMKACPVRAPVRAEEFLRKDLVPTCTTACKNLTVVSAQPFPELEEQVRHELGLPPTAAGGNAGNTRVDAARVRIAFDDVQWAAVRGVDGGGCCGAHHPGRRRRRCGLRLARRDMSCTSAAPKGQLDANEKLFKMIASTIRPEPEWQKMSNGYIANLYHFKATQVAQQQQMVYQFRQHVADVTNQVTANQIAGANQSNFGQDQLTRGVQTFRNPATGGTYELSNQYNNAWLNDSNEYVMSDNPNYNPNGKLDGNWNQLQVVQAQP
jgi:hypothetical protein